MPRYAFRLEFDGRDWNGTATQAGDGQTLQDALEAVLTAHAQRPVKVITCGRLDAGVSAQEFVVHCDLPDERPAVDLGKMLNARLPAVIAVRAAAQVAGDWHARRAACSKTYCYTVYECSHRSAFGRDHHWVRSLPHAERLQPCADRLLGHQDLSGFACLRNDTSDEADPRHTITAVAWSAEPWGDGCLRRFRITGDGFLYKQVRGIVGALLAVARDEDGKSIRRFDEGLTAGRAVVQRSGNIAPACGLTLESVAYDPPVGWQAV